MAMGFFDWAATDNGAFTIFAIVVAVVAIVIVCNAHKLK